ncbi:MAG: fused MFS/spermidine synthase [Deltaproteobacteria bacterium]|nr:fused MFS/spermidine synthase [Deltaproteobacteria bacterium]
MRARSLITALFVASGAVALGLEITWFRRLLPLFGASHAVTGLLLAVYMGGLSLGGALGARLAPSVRNPLRAYAMCELTVALSAALSLHALAWIEHHGLGLSVHSAGLWCALVLLVPTLAMGATTALLVREVTDMGLGFRRAIAKLYSANLAGAALGAWVTGFALLPRFGISSVHDGLCALGAMTGLCAWQLSRIPRTPHAQNHTTHIDTLTHEVSRNERALATLSLFAVGALSFALQVALGRVAALLLGGTAYTFEMLTTTILCALSLGGRLAREEQTRTESWISVSRSLLRLAVAIFLGMLVVRIAPLYLQLAIRTGQRPTVLRWALAIALAAWPHLEIGALFVTLTSRTQQANPGHAAGVATAVSTLGNVSGALLAGFVLMTHFGLQNTLQILAVTALTLATLTALRTDAIRSKSTLIAALLALLFAGLLDRPWDRTALSAATYRTGLNRALSERTDVPCGPGRRLPHTRVLSHRDGALGTVTVLSHSDDARCTLYGLRVNGKTEGSVYVSAPHAPGGAAATDRARWLPVGDLPSELLVGRIVSAVFRARPRDALLVGWGTGISTRALRDQLDGTLTAVEIEPAVLAAGQLFDPQIAQDPAVRVVLDDARRVLRARAHQSLDAVVSHPSNPWVTGASALFSREFFLLARDRLREGGRMVAWVQLYEIDLMAVRSLVATFVSVFPQAIAIRSSERSRDLFLVGARGGEDLEGDRIARILRLDPTTPALRVLGNGASLRRFAADAPIVTDDNALLEYRVADQMLSGHVDPRVMSLPGL